MKALYRKYRSKKLSEVVGQEHVTSTLEKALKTGKISHAYLFTGPRGVGKTSVARILAHEINKLPYTDDSAHLDIIEIDAASNRRIDEIRDLREKVYTAPANAAYKVYIIDEVHMLTREAFNALLKTLEEPPAHVVFILATTDAHKLPETIISRTQRFAFKPVVKEAVAALLAQIAKAEDITADKEALELLAEHGEGSIRDSISLLDQARNRSDKLNAEVVRELLGLPPRESIEQLYQEITAGTSASLMSLLARLYGDGYTPATLAGELSAMLRERITDGAGDAASFDLLERLLDVGVAQQPARYLEITVLRAQSALSDAVRAEQPVTPKHAPVKADKRIIQNAVVPEPIKPEAAKKTPPSSNEPKPEPPAETAKPKQTPVPSSTLDLVLWPQVLAMLKQRHNTLYSVVRMAEPVFIDDGHLSLKFAFAFHQKRINEAANRQLLAGIIKELTGNAVKIECVYSKDATPPKLPSTSAPKAAAPAGDSLDTISNIFGGGELLES